MAATGRPYTGSYRPACASTRAPRDYYERRIKKGKTQREIVRCLKRYAAREVYHLLVVSPLPTSLPA
ncbi:hypothetical protein GCM10010383_68240 [Streptomyces lomondensis]|uniref:Transposase n=1 Tax=Streptomyces lomondensis TaxID=68229 RepID=A0ABQ2XPI8_9ACTN|nr:hypothetical protein GCM10010383_68240 [Streptomyces lomondensis]